MTDTAKTSTDKRMKPDELLDEVGDESFPASDPPSWTPVTRTNPSPARAHDVEHREEPEPKPGSRDTSPGVK